MSQVRNRLQGGKISPDHEMPDAKIASALKRLLEKDLVSKSNVLNNTTDIPNLHLPQPGRSQLDRNLGTDPFEIQNYFQKSLPKSHRRRYG